MSLLQVAEAGDEGDDILMAMARELVTEKGIGESAAAVWKQLVKRQTEVFGSRDVEAAPLPGDAETAGAIPEPIIIPKPRRCQLHNCLCSETRSRTCRSAGWRAGRRPPAPVRANWGCSEETLMRGCYG